MKRTILVLALTLLLSSAVPAQAASLDAADLAQPMPTRSLSSSLGNSGNIAGNLTSNSNGVIPYIEDPPSVSMNFIWYTMLGLLGCCDA